MNLVAAGTSNWTLDLQYGALPERLVRLASGKSAVSETLLDPADPIFAVHFPEWPVLPGSLVLRAALATAAIVEGTSAWRLGTVNRISFRQGARPGSVLRIEVQRSPSAYAYKFIANASGARISDGVFTLIPEIPS